MLTEQQFRQIVLGFTGAFEAEHMGHPDFRANGRIFATLGHDRRRAMVKVTPEQQAELIAAHPSVFSPEAGAWGRGGSTRVDLQAADSEIVGEALTLAHQLVMSLDPPRGVKGPAKKTAPLVKATRVTRGAASRATQTKAASPRAAAVKKAARSTAATTTAAKRPAATKRAAGASARRASAGTAARKTTVRKTAKKR